ncbi:unnamed protein product, partial [Porites evermanni]
FVEYLDNNFRECIILGGSSRPFKISVCLVILVVTFDDLVKGIWGWKANGDLSLHLVPSFASEPRTCMCAFGSFGLLIFQ